MTQDNWPRVSSSQSVVSTDSSSTKQRRKRKWDQPAESLISAGIVVPGVLPLGHVGSLAGMTFQGVSPVHVTSAINHNPISTATLQQVLIAPSLQQHAAALVQKINQTKMQEELIAREIVINDAEPSIRYKLTKRQTQEEIQRSTGSVVITRGKYRPSNGPSDGEKPLYLHISAGAHLETTADRIKAVDRAADMVEEMLKQGSLNNGTKVTQLLSTCVFLGFEADPSLNIVARIRGPNDQYVNHIMNETGATVLLRGRGSGNPESEQGEGQQPLHLLLSSNYQNGLERAKLLAENLLDTICSECGASRVSSCKVYGAVPPPQHLLPTTPANNSTAGSVPVPEIPSTTAPLFTTFLSQGTTTQPVILLSCGSQPNVGGYAQPSVSACTSYNGYGGIYPQTTPLQQVALALRQSSSPVASTVSPVVTVASTASLSSTSLPSEKEKRQRRKFQELPVNSEWPAESHQDQVLSRSRLISNVDGRNISNMPSPKKLTQQAINGFPPPPPKSMLPPPPSKSMSPLPPPKFSSLPVLKKPEENHRRHNTESKAVPDTLIQLMQYGDEDDDEDFEESIGETVKTNSNVQVTRKPFWAA